MKAIIGLIIVLFAQVVLGASVHAERLEMYISPLECTSETINDGVTTQVILTPKQCEKYLQPPNTTTPLEPGAESYFGRIGAPNTGNANDEDFVQDSLLLALLITFISLFLIVSLRHRYTVHRK